MHFNIIQLFALKSVPFIIILPFPIGDGANRKIAKHKIVIDFKRISELHRTKNCVKMHMKSNCHK